MAKFTGPTLEVLLHGLTLMASRYSVEDPDAVRRIAQQVSGELASGSVRCASELADRCRVLLRQAGSRSNAAARTATVRLDSFTAPEREALRRYYVQGLSPERTGVSADHWERLRTRARLACR